MSNPTPRVHELDVHGTVAKYTIAGCRCEQCTAAWMRYVPHGTVGGYTHHKCKCERCKNAKRQYELSRTGRPVTPEPIRYAAPGTWSLEIIRSALVVFTTQHERLPNDHETFGLPAGRTWGGARAWASKQGHTLRTLTGAPRKVSAGFEWSCEVIMAAALAFAETEGCWPTIKHGACEAFGGRRWAAAAAWLREEKGVTLASLQRVGPSRYGAHYSTQESAVSL